MVTQRRGPPPARPAAPLRRGRAGSARVAGGQSLSQSVSQPATERAIAAGLPPSLPPPRGLAALVPRAAGRGEPPRRGRFFLCLLTQRRGCRRGGTGRAWGGGGGGMAEGWRLPVRVRGVRRGVPLPGL